MSNTTEEELHERMAIGTVIDSRYEVTGYMGRGGFAGGYEANHIHLQRRIAVKVLDLPGTPASGRQFRERFLQEARIAARIRHPGVVDIYDFGLLDDTQQPYIAMEYLDGDDLEKHLVKAGPLEVAAAVELFSECLEALDEGHGHGIVHKDLKPSNLFLTDDASRLVILDFGVARVFTDPEAKLTQTGGFSGTPAYLAPEYIEFQTVTPRLDVYQMGLILIEAITGKPAVHAGSSMAYMMAHCTGEVRIPRVLTNTALGEVLAKATALAPDDRYRDAGEFRDALKALDLSTLPVRVSSVSQISNAGESIDVLAETNPFLSSETGDPVLSSEQRVRVSQVPTAQQPDEKTNKVIVRLIAIAALAVIALGGTIAYLIATEDEKQPTNVVRDTVAVPTDGNSEQEETELRIEEAKQPIETAIGESRSGVELAHAQADAAQSEKAQEIIARDKKRSAADRRRAELERQRRKAAAEAAERRREERERIAREKEAERRAAEQHAAEKAASEANEANTQKKPSGAAPSIAP